MLLTISNKWLGIIKGFSIAFIGVVVIYGIFVLLSIANDKYSHYHQFTVVDVLECMGDSHLKCRVKLDNGNEAIVRGMTAVGYTVNRYSWIEEDDDGGTEWFQVELTNGKGRNTNDDSHDAAWERFRKENP